MIGKRLATLAIASMLLLSMAADCGPKAPPHCKINDASDNGECKSKHLKHLKKGEDKHSGGGGNPACEPGDHRLICG